MMFMNNYLKVGRMKNILVLVSVLTLITSCKDIQKEYYKNGNVESEIEVKDNMKNGLSRWYYPNGELKFEANYVNDKEEGKVKKFYDNGKLNTTAYFKNGIQDGNFIEYYHDGGLKSELYYTNGIQDKVNKFYYTNQQLRMEALSNKGATVYYIKYDSLGNWLDEFMWLEVTTKDTVFVGEEYRFDIKIPGPTITKEDSVVCTFDIIDMENKTPIENRIEHELFLVKDNFISFSYTANRTGSFFYYGIVITNDRNKKRKEHKIEMGNIYVIDKVVN